MFTIYYRFLIVMICSSLGHPGRARPSSAASQWSHQVLPLQAQPLCTVELWAAGPRDPGGGHRREQLMLALDDAASSYTLVVVVVVGVAGSWLATNERTNNQPTTYEWDMDRTNLTYWVTSSVERGVVYQCQQSSCWPVVVENDCHKMTTKQKTCLRQTVNRQSYKINVYCAMLAACYNQCRFTTIDGTA